MTFLRLAEVYHEYKTLCRIVAFALAVLLILLGGLLVNTSQYRANQQLENELLPPEDGVRLNKKYGDAARSKNHADAPKPAQGN